MNVKVEKIGNYIILTHEAKIYEFPAAYTRYEENEGYVSIGDIPNFNMQIDPFPTISHIWTDYIDSNDLQWSDLPTFLEWLRVSTAGVDGSGSDGADGLDGADGYTPIKGVDYFDGADGAQGLPGNDGQDGVQGIQGIQGEPGSSGSSAYASFYLSTGGLTGQSNTERTLVINETSVNEGGVFSLSTNQVTVNKAGNYKIDFDCYFNNSSTSRTEYTFWAEVNDVEVSGTRTGNYQRGYDSGQTSSISFILPLLTDDVLQFRVNRTDGAGVAGYQDNNGTRLTIEEK